MKFEVEDLIVKNLLELELGKSNIRYEFFQFESDVLGKSSLIDGKIGYFEVSDQDAVIAKEILDNIIQSKLEDEISSTKTNQVITVPRILLSVLILVLFGTIAYLVYDNQRLEKLTHYAENTSDYTRKWNDDKTILSRYLKESGTLEAEYFDRNFNNKWEEEKFYDKNGKLRSDNISEKDDGFFNTTYYYNQAGDLVQKIHTSSKSLRNDVLQIFIDSNNYFEFRENSDGKSYYSFDRIQN